MVIFYSGFEQEGLPDWDVAEGYTRVTDPVKEGTYALMDGGDFELLKTFDGHSVVYARFFVQWNGLISTENEGILFAMLGDDWNIYTAYITIYQKKLVLHVIIPWDGDVEGSPIVGTTVLESDVWYCVELRHAGTNPALVQLFLNGNLEAQWGGPAWTGTITTIEFFAGGLGDSWTNMFLDDVVLDDSYIGCDISLLPEGDMKIGDAEYGYFDLFFIQDFEEGASRPIPRKSVLGKCTPTPEASNFSTRPRRIVLKVRLDSDEKASVWNLHKRCVWQKLIIKRTTTYIVWIERITFRWDSDLGCGGRQWLATITLLISRFRPYNMEEDGDC